MYLASLNKTLLLSFLVVGCSLPPSKSTPIARVNGSEITLGDYQDLMESLRPKEGVDSSEKKAELRNLVIRTLVRREVVVTEAKKKGITLSNEEVQDGLKKIKDGYSETSFEQSLSDQMIDANIWHRNVEQSLLIEKLFDESAPKIPSPSNRELMEFFEKNRHLFQKKASVRAQHIVVAQQSLADDIHAKLKKRPQDFVSLAKEHSSGPEAQDGAVIQVDKDTLPEAIDLALFSLKIGQLSPVIQSPYGFHLFKVISRSPALNLDFQNVKDQIAARLTRQRRLEWIDRFEEKLIRMADIEYNRELIKKL
jgi:parvulin-like peptidyl-prolyl isomerase